MAPRTKLTDEERRRNAAEASRRWREKHPGRAKESMSRWRRLNREHLREYAREYASANREAVRAKRHLYWIQVEKPRLKAAASRLM